ncbi:MAG: hypothetical protein GC161_08555 [Planctomycetaceae bacterium]|nr:hypothetical protein [Planctomycetaceae bacterium]
MSGPDGDVSDEDLLAELLWLAPVDPRRVEILRRRPDLAPRLADLEAAGVNLERRFGVSSSDASADDEAGGERWGDEDLDRGTREFEDAALGRFARTLRDRESASPASSPPGPALTPAPGAPAAPAHPPSPGTYPWRLGPVLATLATAAALAAMVWFAGGGRPDAEPRPPVWLAGSHPEVQAEPAGPTADVRFFAWDAPPGPGSAQRVEVWLGREMEGAADIVSEDLLAPRWEPGQDVLGQLLGEFRWRVVEESLITETRPRVLFDRHRVPLSRRP